MPGVDLRHLAPRRQLRRRDVLPALPAVARDLDQTVVSAGPDPPDVFGRRRDRIDDAPVLAALGVLVGHVPQGRRRARVGARQVGADRLPVLPAVGGLPENLRGEEEDVRIGGGEDHGRGAIEAELARAQGNGPDVLRLAGPLVVSGELSAVDQPGMQRIGSDVAVLLDADGMELAKRDLPVVAAADDRGRARLLLRAIDAVREPIVGRDVEELRGRLVVPARPGLPAVDREGRSLVASEQDDPRVLGMDPDAVVVVSARRALDRGETLAPIRRAVGRGVGRVDDVRVLRVHPDLGEVGGAPGDAAFGVDPLPALASVVGAEESARPCRGFDDRVHPIAVARSDRDADPAQALGGGGETLRQLPPVVPAVGRDEEPAARPAVSVAVLPGTLPRRPEDRIDLVGICRIESEIDRSRVLVLVEDLPPGLPAVGRAEHAALRIGAVGVPQHGDEEALRVARVHQDRPDLAAVGKPHVTPALPGVGGLVDAVADRKIGPLQAFAAPDVDHVRIRRRDRERAD